jgi:hypothetical protein
MPKFRRYSQTERQLALIFFERVRLRHSDDAEAIKEAAKISNVEEEALRYWLGGGDENDIPDGDTDTDWEAPDGIPLPPEHMHSDIRFPESFAPARDLAEWVREQFIEETGELWNEDHWHLAGADIAWEWTNVQNARQQRGVAAQTQMVGGSGGGRWDKAREEYHLKQVWGDVPIFRITVDTVWWMGHADANRCALVDHELYHCGLKRKLLTGEPVFGRGGRPQYAIQGHDFEGFKGVMERWGVGAAEAGAAEIVEAANRRPRIAAAQITRACGTCRR